MSDTEREVEQNKFSPKLGVFENIILRGERLYRSSVSVFYKSGKKRAYLLVCRLLRNNWDVNIILWKLRDLLLVWLKSSNTGDNSMRSSRPWMFCFTKYPFFFYFNFNFSCVNIFLKFTYNKGELTWSHPHFFFLGGGGHVKWKKRK